MFNLVGHPYAINPTRELLDRIAIDQPLKEKIQIVVERKNVVYLIDSDKIKIK